MKGFNLTMLQKKDIHSLIAWSAPSALMLTAIFQNAISTSTFAIEQTNSYNRISPSASEEGKVFVFGIISTLASSFVASFVGSRHGASMTGTYDHNNLLDSVSKVTAIIGGIMGVLNAVCCTLIGQNMQHLQLNNLFDKNNDNTKFDNTFNLTDFALKTTLSAIVMSTLGYYIANANSQLFRLDVEPLSLETLAEEERFGLETLEKKNELCLDDALKKIKNAKGDIFKVLSTYNMVYSRKFTNLGTPMDMARRANDNDLLKKLTERNHELILGGLYNVKNSRNNLLD